MIDTSAQKSSTDQELEENFFIKQDRLNREREAKRLSDLKKFVTTDTKISASKPTLQK